MTEKLEHSIKTKHFSFLSQDEREELLALQIDEEGFNALKSFYVKLGKKSTKMEVGSDVKNRLDELFTSTYLNKQPTLLKRVVSILFPQEKSWLMRPIIQLASVMFLVTLGITIFNTNKSFDRNLSQYIPKKLDILKEGNALEEVEEKEQIDTQRKRNSALESRRNEIERTNYEVLRAESTTNRGDETPATPLDLQETIMDAEVNTFSGVTAQPNFSLEPSYELGKTTFLNTPTNAAAFTFELSSKERPAIRNEQSIANDEIISVPNVTQNASFNNLAVLDLLTPLF
jgi:hypothetical protein